MRNEVNEVRAGVMDPAWEEWKCDGSSWWKMMRESKREEEAGSVMEEFIRMISVVPHQTELKKKWEKIKKKRIK